MKALILGAGYATRLYPLTKDRPKPLLPIKGKPLIDYILEEIESIPAIDETYVVTNHRFFTHFDEWAKNKRVKVLDDGTTDEQTRLGAIGDIKFTIDHFNIDDDLLIIAGDNLFTYSLFRFYEFFRQKQADSVVAKIIYDREQLKSFAVATTDDTGKITSLIEKPQDPPSNIAIFAGYLYRRDTLPLIQKYLDEGNKPDAPGYFVEWLHKNRSVYAWYMDGECYDIGTLPAYEHANATFVK